MRLINTITENIVLPLSDIALGQSIYKHLKFLKKSQWWSESELKDYQNKKLRALIKHAYENVPIVSDVGNMTDVAWHNVNAMVVDDYMDIETFTKYAEELLKDRTKREMLSKNGCKLVKDKYSVEAQSKIIENILKYGENL